MTGTLASTMFQRLTRPQWLLPGAVMLIALVAALAVKWYRGPTISTPPEYPEANLRIDVLYLSQASKAIANYEIGNAFLECPAVDVGRGSKSVMPPWFRRADSKTGRGGFCGAKAMNLPVRTDEDGQATLWFEVVPPPQRARVDFDRRPPYAPALFLPHPYDGSQGIGLEPLAVDHWLARFIVRREL